MTNVEYLDRELMDNVYLISKGVRTVYYGAIHLKKEELYEYMDYKTYNFLDVLELFKEYIEEFNLFMYVQEIEDMGENFIDYWVYKYKHQKNILDLIYQEQNNYLKQWMMGKLLGYSDEAMEEFLNQIR